MIAPMTAEESKRRTYLPKGGGCDFWSDGLHPRKSQLEVAVPLDQIPIFVRSGAVFPLAEPGLHPEDEAGWRLTAQVYGENASPALLYEDDGSVNRQMTEVTLRWDPARRAGSAERVGRGG
jgi:alpha-D-xyloside xylohydrolase